MYNQEYISEIEERIDYEMSFSTGAVIPKQTTHNEGVFAEY